jgi:hypothetical protein
MIRLTWRATSERVDDCRRLSPEELAALPAHMRREEVCEGRTLPYLLRVALDGDTVVQERVEPRGTREDRPLYVFHEIPVTPGERALEIAFVREDVRREAREGEEGRGEARGGEQARRDEERQEEARSAADRVREGRAALAQETPGLLQFSGRVRLQPRQIALITYDPERRVLVLKGYGQSP